MAEPPSDRPTRAPLFDPGPEDGAAEFERPSGYRWVFWLAGLVVLAAAIVTAVLLVPRPSPQETAARRAAVGRYAELYRVSTESVDKYCKVRAKPVAGGAWIVDVSRIISPGSGGFHVTTTFRVDRDGAARYVGKSEGRIE